MADIRNWIRNIEQHASDNVNKILVGNKADMDESKRVNYSVRSSLQLLKPVLSVSLNMFQISISKVQLTTTNFH